MKKLLLGLGAATAVVAPIAAVVACGSTDKKDANEFDLSVDVVTSNISNNNGEFAKILKPLLEKIKKDGVSNLKITLKNGNKVLETANIDFSKEISMFDDKSKTVPNSAGNKDGTAQTPVRVGEYLTSHKLQIKNDKLMKIGDSLTVEHLSYAVRMLIGGVTKLEQFPGLTNKANGFAIDNGRGSWNYPISATADVNKARTKSTN